MSNQVYANQTVQYIEYDLVPIYSKLPQDPVSLTTNLSGPYTAIPYTFKYIVNDTLCTLLFSLAGATATNGTSQEIVTPVILPPSIRPTGFDRIVPVVIIIGAPVYTTGYCIISTSGIIRLRLEVNQNFPNGQICGIGNCQATYSIS